jgi:hypothetical protein
MSIAEPLRVNVLASAAMKKFRDEQNSLNHLLWSTEICYGHVLATVPGSDDDVWTSFQHANTQAWHPNREGRRKYEKTVNQFRKHVARNQRYLHRTILTHYYSAFEHYLTTRVVSSREKKKETAWGPFFSKLKIDQLTTGAYRLRPRTLLTADYCRLARNGIVHHNTPTLPRKVDDRVATDWLAKILREQTHLAAWGATPETAKACLERLVTGVRSRVTKAHAAGKAPSYDFFYALFAFTHLDALAFEIEEALFDPALPPSETIRKQPSKVRRQEMIVA